MKIKLATWNINSVRLRQDQVVRFLQEEQPDVLGLQEIKCLEEQFPYKPFREIGYEHIEVSGQKGYHGTATLSKLPMERLPTSFCPLDHARHVSTRVIAGSEDFEFHNFYIPAGGDIADPTINDKFQHKLDFIEAMRVYFAERFAKGDDQQVLVGDFNIAPHENDVWSHKQLLKVVSHTPLEVGLLETLRQTHDFTDCSRLFADDAEKLYSWWSYRGKNPMVSNRGRRLDHIWVSPALRPSVEAAGKNGHHIHVPCRTWHEKPSDHVPMTQDLDLSAK
ncbi:exodeoxyribonuclease III [Litorimonas sp. RW-G-Af-16]|uniref:exodeoxyribonuclease III n=1 Tax=Litorimonas sp. RW-G-Af-16 TaxID=3241168 RepID=UPI00390C6AE3